MTGIVVSSGFVVSPGADNLNADSPIVGYRNRVPESTLSATTADDNFPVTNLNNPATHLRWQADAALPASDVYITVIFDPDSSAKLVDYLAIARHNLGSGQAVVSVEGTHAEPVNPEDWVELVGEHLLPNDGPTIFRFTRQGLFGIRLRIQPSQSLPVKTRSIAVLFVGELLSLQRRIYVGHTPLHLGRETTIANHRSIDGCFLGRIILGASTSTSVELSNLTPAWYRAYMDPFLIEARENPFFFGWRPGAYPYEAGYAWLTDDPRPTNSRTNGMMSVSLDLKGIV
jgi:hypothetical protein